MSKHLSVRVWTEEVVIPTYMPAAPDLNPMFLEKRVYQGSSGKVYPLPFTDRITEQKIDRRWKAVWLENRYLRLMILPEIGGRIHLAQDKTNGYDFIYNQKVIKPALVGLAGPWISGGIEFNWPQHHRPATFLPADVEIEENADGSKTVWLGDHDPMCRLKGMHGVCLHPEKAYIEVKVRAYNRTLLPQPFLWWANVGTRVHEAYQSFFPPDAHYVADHAKRATSEYPLCQGVYYGVDYGERGRNGVPADERPKHFLPPHCGGRTPVDYRANDLAWYANIPTPCSYMCMGTQEDFFGGYDHFRRAGIVHVADHHISPGKKQWTWGNHDFGYAWDRNLTDGDGPYIELMAGVYTDNQPDFSFLQPGETKTWSQFWYPIQKIGPAHHANLEAALNLAIDAKQIRLGVSVSSDFPQAKIRLEAKHRDSLEWTADLSPGNSFTIEQVQPTKKWPAIGVTVRVLAHDGREIISYTPKPPAKVEVPKPAQEPLLPQDIPNTDELYLTGLHLHQYRHATRCPTLYWREALRRDPFDFRCNNALGLWHLRRGEFTAAALHFRVAISRLTRHNANPYDGEAHYNLGVCLRFQMDAEASSPVRYNRLFDEAYAALYKATWNQAWQSAGNHALAEMDCLRADWNKALAHLDHSLRYNADNLRARALKAIVLDRLKRRAEADALLRATLALDPLDWWARYLSGEKIACDQQVRLDLAIDFIRAGFYTEARDLLQMEPRDSHTPPNTHPLPAPDWGAAPLVQYYLGWIFQKLGDPLKARRHQRQGRNVLHAYCFPSRLEDIAVLELATHNDIQDSRAPYYLGNLFYDRGRHADAIKLWQRSAKADPTFSIVWRNLGIGHFNISKNPARARAAYDRALKAKPADARLLYERDQLWKRLGDSPQRRLAELEQRPDLTSQRDDLAIELCALYNQTGRHALALELITRRHFQPWEGGEGQALAQHTRTHLALGRQALACRDFSRARASFNTALTSPHNLGEAKHLLANQSDIYYWLGVACKAEGDHAAAKKYWRASATFSGDFQQMSVRAFSEMTYFSALSWGRLGQRARMRQLLHNLLAYAKRLQKTQARIDYFATSLPTMLLFDDDSQFRQDTTAMLLQAQAHLGLGNKSAAKRLLSKVLKRDPNHALALDLLAMEPPAA